MTIARDLGVRVLYGFAAGFVVAAALWVLLDLQAPIARAPRPLRSSPTATTSPVDECAPPEPTRSVPALARPRNDRDAILTSATRLRSERPENLDKADATIAPHTITTRPRSERHDGNGMVFVIAAGAGTEVPFDGGFDQSAATVGVRFLVQPDRHLGFELGLARARSRARSSTTVDALVKWHLGDHRVRPYAAAGIGWRRRHGPRPEDVVTVPVGVGISYQRGRWFADGRLTIRAALQGDGHTAAGTGFVGVAF